MSVRTMRRRHRVTRTRATTCHTKTSVPSLGKGTRPATEQAKRDQSDRERGIVGKELMNGRAAREMEARKEARSAPRAANLIGTVTRTKGAREKGNGKGKSETRYCYDCGEQEHVGVNCSYKWANSMDEEDDQTSSWESEPEGEC